MVANSNFDSLTATTLDKWVQTLEENVYTARPLMFWLNDRDRIKAQGGATIIIPLIVDFNSTAGSYNGYDTIETTPQDELSAAQFDWKQYAASVAISGRERAINRSEQQMVNLLEAKTKSAEESIKENLDYMFFQDGTGNSSKDFHGLKSVVNASANFGGVSYTFSTTDPAGNTIYPWRSNVTVSAANLTLSTLSTHYNGTSVGNDHPDFIVSDQDEYEAYEALLQPALRYANPKYASAGFDNLTYKRATWTYDDYCTAGYVYTLNSKYISLVRHDDVWFKRTPWKEHPNQDAQYSQVLLMGELVCNHRSRLGVITGLTD